MNYQIIRDERVLKDFIEWLPNLEANEMYYVSLFARKKYCPSLKSDKAQLKRFTSRKDLLFSKIKQLECEVGTYTQDGVSIPNDALAVYISINPRNVELATKKALKKFADLITSPYNGYNPQSEVLNEIQTATGTRYFHDFDFDNVDMFDVITEINKLIPNKFDIIETKNGFHVLVNIPNLTLEEKKKYYNISKIPGCDVKGDNLVPIPGCAQSNFMPSLLKPRIIADTHPSHMSSTLLNDL